MLDKIRDLVFGAVLVGLFVILPYQYAFTDTFKENPYYTESIVGHTQGDNLFVVTDILINKETCEFNRLEVFGDYLGQWFILPWSNTLDNDTSGDRLDGRHTIRLTVEVPEELGLGIRDFNSFDVRTRHLCGEDDPTTKADDRYFIDKILGSLRMESLNDKDE